MYLSERVAWSNDAIDEEAAVIRRVKILGLRSSNGRRYRREALEAAKGLYEGIGVNFDHRTDDQRRVSDGFGRLVRVATNEDGLYGDLEYLRSHPYANWFLESARRMPEQLGLSHSAEGDVTDDKDGPVVEQIHKVRSVDLVRYPATTRGLFESDITEVTGYGAMQGDNTARAFFRGAIMAILDDASLSMHEIGRKIMTILKTEQKVLGPAQPEPPEVEEPEATAPTGSTTESETPAGGPELEPSAPAAPAAQAAPAGDEKVSAETPPATPSSADATGPNAQSASAAAESAIQTRLSAIESSIKSLAHSLDLMECVQAHRLDIMSLSGSQYQELREKQTRAEMDQFADGLPPSARIRAIPAAQPSANTVPNYQQLREDLVERFRFKK